MMPVRGLKFVNEFLVPHLNSKRFGTRLMWLNSKYSIFQVKWCHKSATDWTSYDAEVFMEWDKVKGRGLTDDKERFTKSKQRFRAIIYKLIKGNHITELCNGKCTKIYCLGIRESIPNEVIERALRESRVNSSERIYKFDPETVIDVGEISDDSCFVENQTVSIMEEHKYANCLEEVVTENEDIVPDNHVQQNNSMDVQHLYINVLNWKCLPDKYSTVLKLEDCSLEDLNGSNLVCTLNDDIRWRDNSEISQYGLALDENIFQPESFLNRCDKIDKCSTIDENQSLSFSEVWNSDQL